MTEFFDGTRTVCEFTLEFHNGRAVLACSVKEHWENILFSIVRCGAKETEELERRVGISHTDKKVLEDAIKSSVGIKGLAEISSTLSEQTSSEIKWEEIQTHKKTFSFEALKYGRYTALRYQLIRTIALRFQDNRFLHRDSWAKSIEQWLNNFYDGSKSVEQDPECQGASLVQQDEIEGTFMLDCGNISVLVGYRQVPEGLEIRYRNITHVLSWATPQGFSATIPRDFLEPDLLFLAAEDADQLEGRFTPYIEESIWVPAVAPVQANVEVPYRTLGRGWRRHH